MIAIIDYGIGNLFSVSKALNRLGQETQITCEPETVEKASAIVLPGVGSFGEAMENLQKKELINVILKNADEGKPILGICLGMQILFERSQESPHAKGLSLIQGEVRKLPPTNKIPHIGWNRIYFKKKTELTEDIPQGRFFYFAHSYYVLPADDQPIIGICNYNLVIPAIINQDNIWGVQFHPEKSSTWGMKFLENWVRCMLK
ncbi:imidazole glycerol phosphate synthase subunit HisH [Atrimonas thermophila]|uniref:imidazole glycerol phosphate synthase subunit HisH n=1 Tax=Atrimonas thermophila TaxID=3064161 RepID=UPI00399CAE39